jgi:TolB protein
VPIVPDGAREASFDGHRLAEQDAMVFDLDSGQGRALHLGLTIAPGLRWSPDGSRIVFQAFDAESDTGTIHSVAPDGSELRSVAGPDSRIPLDDGDLMLADGTGVVVGDRTSGGTVVAPIDGVGSQRVLFRQPDGTTDGFWSVSPDGQRVAFVREHTGKEDLYVVGTDGSDERIVLQNVFDPAPVWSPDGTLVLIRHNYSGETSSGPQYFNIVPVDALAPARTASVPIPMSADLGVVSWQGVP